MGQRLSILGVELNNLLHPFIGVDLAPRAFRYAGLHHMLQNCCGINGIVFDYGDIVLDKTERIQVYLPEPPNLSIVSSILQKTQELTYYITLKRQIQIVLGGDELVSLGVVEGLSRHYKKMGMICFDAHLNLGDENTISMFSFLKKSFRKLQIGRDLDKISEEISLDNPLSPQSLVFIGARDYSRLEILAAKEYQVKIYSIMDVEKMGISKIIDETIDYLADCDGVHLSFDFDCLDGEMLPGISDPISMGLTPKETMIAMNLLYQAGLITSSEFFGIDCCKDINNHSGKVAVQLIGTLFGAKSL